MKLPGQVVGPFSIVRTIGRGRLATVYLATDRRTSAQVALKLFDPGPRSDAVLARFLPAQPALLALRHPRIVSVLEPLQETPDGRLLVTEYVAGSTLAAHLSGMGRLRPTLAVRFVRELLDAASAAHAREVFHLDLKPANVFLDAEGHLRLADFGLAAPALPAGDPAPGAASASATAPAPSPGPAPWGSAAYLAPEVARGAAVDARANLYSLGLILFEMLAGHAPFEAIDEAGVLRLQLESPPPPLLERVPTLAPELNAVVVRALAKEPGARFASAAEMDLALASIPGMRAAELAAERSMLALATANLARGAPKNEGEDFLGSSGFAAPEKNRFASAASFGPGVEEEGPRLRSTTVFLGIVLAMVVAAWLYEPKWKAGNLAALRVRDPARELYAPGPPSALPRPPITAANSHRARIRLLTGESRYVQVDRIAGGAVRLIDRTGTESEIPLDQVIGYEVFGPVWPESTLPAAALGPRVELETRSGKRFVGNLQALRLHRIPHGADLVLEGGATARFPLALVHSIRYLP
ncbi:MAG: serine/threonine protein kinase [Planctomycetes bacterium]|nr:serine/threonine protein kinase [Planctomycetota bacterium]